ncbi:hypothetical protein CSOJ01_12704 [Colletotrichum sojae]|uniref:Rhodopsin domain-containing protein n=1 Tax=Colletotrichum sojae TaxID=2175907 RepID=A0A8H6IU64_9PEZI|nr:hypothetical protein CSOJ01_12704 [Colletotrichum sojae]
MDDPTEWHPVQPEGLAAAIFGVTIGSTAVCLVVVGLRVWVRAKLSTFGFEDYLMVAGVAISMAHNAIVMYGAFTGIGSPDSKLDVAIMIEGAKASPPSICATLIRIATHRRFVYTLYGLITMSAVSTFIAILAVLIRCKPVAASWNPALGTCLPQTIIITLTYVVSVINIVNDFTVAIIPIIMLWNVQMRRKLKIITTMVLGLGILASTATIIRMPYSTAYSNPENLLQNVGNIILWTVVECGMGIIAGSLPMLRQLFKGLAKDQSSKDESYVLRARTGRWSNLGNGGTAEDDHDSPLDTETDSTHQIVKTTRVDVTEGPAPSAETRGSSWQEQRTN